MPYKDPEVKKAKQQQYSRKYYVKNREQTKENVKNRKKALYEWWRNFKASMGCFACEESDPECIDFHHVITDEKKHTRDSAHGWVYDKQWSREKIVEELWRSCVPLCSNCHRKLHIQHRRWLKEERDASCG